MSPHLACLEPVPGSYAEVSSTVTSEGRERWERADLREDRMLHELRIIPGVGVA
jgi:hypothetical protein